eukprot:gene15887-16442_t
MGVVGCAGTARPSRGALATDVRDAPPDDVEAPLHPR